MSFNHISIVGSGNLCWHLLHLFGDKKGSTLQVYARSENKLEELRKEFPSVKTFPLTPATPIEGDLVLLAVKDDVLEDMSRYTFSSSAVVVHLSGARSLKPIMNLPVKGLAVVYPFQTFTKGRPVYWRQIPIFIEASSSELENQLIEFLSELHLSIHKANQETRKHVQLCGVLVNNFVHYLFHEALILLEEKGLDRKILSPIITETVSKFLEIEDPSTAQSGPASRKDFKTIGKHLELLEKFPNLKSAYEELTKAIINKP